MSEPIDTREVGASDELASGLLTGPSSGGSSPAPSEASVPAVIEPHTYRPELVLDPEAAGDLVTKIREMQRSVLVQGTDYDRIPGTPKPSLLKPGAERLLQVFGLGHSMEQLATERDDNGKVIGFFYRCTVTKVLMDGRTVTVSMCDGYCGRDEQKWKSAPINTVLKMAQKRALVGAALTATATSGLFTQDMEDAEPLVPRQQSRSRRARDPSEAGPASAGITSPQRKKIHASFNELGIEDRDARLTWCADIIGRPLGSSNDLTMDEAGSVIEALDKELASGKPIGGEGP